MKRNRVGRTLKELRKRMDKTQEQLSGEVLQSRESLSKQENGNRSVQPGLTRQFITKYNNPRVALEAANEYIGWGITYLDGPNAENDRFFLQLILVQELSKALEAISGVKLEGDQANTHSMEKQDIYRSTKDVAKIVHFSTLYLAMVCETYDISWLKIWKDHHNDLKSKGYVSS